MLLGLCTSHVFEGAMLRLMQRQAAGGGGSRGKHGKACVGAQHLLTDQPPARPAVHYCGYKVLVTTNHATTVPYLNHHTDAKLFHRCCSGITCDKLLRSWQGFLPSFCYEEEVGFPGGRVTSQEHSEATFGSELGAHTLCLRSGAVYCSMPLAFTLKSNQH